MHRVVAMVLGVCSMHRLLASEVRTAGLALAAVQMKNPQALQAKKLQLFMQLGMNQGCSSGLIWLKIYEGIKESF